ncbi:hypothetical protein IGB42_00981 [Andreprevotia sp. IGB-42]|nr:hypothetical protein IGB42_00981 [Andreprevotia sp. IGB-42]
MTMRPHIGARLHGNGKALDGVIQLRMEIVIGTQARGTAGVVSQLKQCSGIQFLHGDSKGHQPRTLAPATPLHKRIHHAIH